MTAENEFNQITEACLKAHDLLKARGTPDMQATMRILLLQIGQEIARRQTEFQKKLDASEGHTAPHPHLRVLK